jgi:hypothetical protein
MGLQIRAKTTPDFSAIDGHEHLLHNTGAHLVSENLRGYSYDPVTRILTIAFQSGRTYNYEPVNIHLVRGLAEAESPNDYFTRFIKRHAHEEVTKETK